MLVVEEGQKGERVGVSSGRRTERGTGRCYWGKKIRKGMGRH